MLSRYFIDRPIFAWVIALCISLGGFLALRGLPIEQYPEIAPPSLTITAIYPGADASTLEQNVTQVIEQQLNGVDGFLYMSSSSDSSGQASITLTFEPGTDIDLAQTAVQNRLSTVEARLPEDVRRQGIQVRQSGFGSFLMIVALRSRSGETEQVELGSVAASQVLDELRRVPGVGDVLLFGSEYAMRIWLDPERLASYRLSASQVMAAVREQNSQTPGGALGALPVGEGQQVNATIVTRGRLTTPREFEEIILRADTGGATVRLGDVARVELGARDYNPGSTWDGTPMAGMGIQLATGANQLETADAVRVRMEQIAPTLPPDIEWVVPYNSTPFVAKSISEVVQTLVEAMLLVFLVMYLFLQNWRATLIPALVVPISLAGACLGLWMFGFSINVLTLFAMVLAIGILVDDAIVVIENVERIMREEGLPPLQATRKAMDQITGAIIGITLVLVAVFLPMAFFPGSTGGIYRQFSVTLAISILFSAFLALTLTPALCATFLKPFRHEEEAGISPDDPADAAGNDAQADSWRGLLMRAGRWARARLAGFNRWFAETTNRYGRANDRILGRPMRALAVFGVLVALTAFLFLRLPTAFLPTEDQGFLITVVQAPPGSTRERTDEAIEPAASHWLDHKEADSLVVLRGFSFFGRGQNNAMMFVNLKPWEERKSEGSKAGAMAMEAMGKFSQNDKGIAFVIQPPPIASLGIASGFTFKLQDRGGLGREALTAARDQMLGLGGQSDLIANLRPDEQPPVPQLKVEIDRVLARALGLSIADVNATLSVNFGSSYANDFNRKGRILQVLVQADAPYRMTPEDVLAMRVPNAQGELVPFSAFAKTSWTAAPPSLARYNGYPAMTISGEARPGQSSGAAIAEMEQLAEQLPRGIGYEWTGLSFEEKQAAGQVPMLLGLSVLVVFLLLAALYESWSVPLAVLLIVPTGVLGAVVFAIARGLSADIYFNVGLVTIIGLAAKNAILIVEFAVEEEERGRSVLDAVKTAARLRLRPILMTSMAFVLGMVPLVIASGAGAASRIAVGTSVMGGMLTATAIGIFLIPVLYLIVRQKISRKAPHAVIPEERDTAEILPEKGE